MADYKPVTAGELRQLLADVADSTVVLLSTDEEGNGFGTIHPEGAFSRCFWRRGSFGQIEMHEREKGKQPAGYEQGIIIWPA